MKEKSALKLTGIHIILFGLLSSGIISCSTEASNPQSDSFWGHKNPYKGDVINIFNGEVNEALDRAWPFFEFESSSSAKELKVNEEMLHKQSIYHFERNVKYLNNIAKKVLGVSLANIKDVFN